jgi:hypothetical protein
VMEVPEFGSRVWVEQALFAILTQAREQATKFYETKARESPDAVDLEAYSYIRISRRKRTLWRMLQDLSVRIEWLSVDPEFGTIEIEPSYSRPWAWHDPVADKMMAEFRHCSKDSVSCVPPARPVQRLSGLVSTCGTRFSDHVQSNTTL